MDGEADATRLDLARVLAARFLLGLAYRVAPQAWYDSMEQSEAERIARKTGVIDGGDD